MAAGGPRPGRRPPGDRPGPARSRGREAGTQLAVPTGVISQDWGAQLGFDGAARWRAWAPDLTYRPIDAGHIMAEERPTEIAAFIRGLID